MTRFTEIIACPVCGTEVSLTDSHCPKCNAEFAPGVMDEPIESAANARTKERRPGRAGSSKRGVMASTQATALGLTYAIGYGSIIAANYISSGGIVNQSYEQLMLLLGGVTLLVAFVSALAMSRVGNTAKASKTSFAMIATFLLLIPPLLLLFKW